MSSRGGDIFQMLTAIFLSYTVFIGLLKSIFYLFFDLTPDISSIIVKAAFIVIYIFFPYDELYFAGRYDKHNNRNNKKDR
jgi:ABC-type polysaccharide/polyol phosphate export permease